MRELSRLRELYICTGRQSDADIIDETLDYIYTLEDTIEEVFSHKGDLRKIVLYPAIQDVLKK